MRREMVRGEEEGGRRGREEREEREGGARRLPRYSKYQE